MVQTFGHMEVSWGGGRLLGPGWGLGPPQAGSAARRGSLSQALPCGGRGWGLVRPQVPGGGRTGPAAAAPQTPWPCSISREDPPPALSPACVSGVTVTCFPRRAAQWAGSRVLLPSDPSTCRPPLPGSSRVRRGRGSASGSGALAGARPRPSRPSHPAVPSGFSSLSPTGAPKATRAFRVPEPFHFELLSF